MVVRVPVDIEVSLTDTHFIIENGNIVIFLEEYNIDCLLRVETTSGRVPGYSYDTFTKRLTIFSNIRSDNHRPLDTKLIKFKINCYSVSEERDKKINELLS